MDHDQAIRIDQIADRAVYAYNGLHQRVRRWADSDSNGSIDEQNLYYYDDDDWRLLEEQVESGWSGAPASPGGAFDPGLTRQYIWGPHYVDELVAILVDTNNDGCMADTGEPLACASGLSGVG